MADIRREKNGDRETVIFSGDLTVQHAVRIAESLRDALQQAAVLDIVLERITSLDVTFPQALCAAHRSAAALSKDISVQGEQEEPVASFLRSAGFLRHIGCQENTRKTCLWIQG